MRMLWYAYVMVCVCYGMRMLWYAYVMVCMHVMLCLFEGRSPPTFQLPHQLEVQRRRSLHGHGGVRMHGGVRKGHHHGIAGVGVVCLSVR